MRLKIAIAIIVAMLVAMPVTHYKAYKYGRVTLSEEAVKLVGKYTFVLNGKLATLTPEISRNFLACSSSCHGRVI